MIDAQPPVHAAASAHADDLCTFLDASPTPYHAVAEIADRLKQQGFVELGLSDDWSGRAGGNYVIRGGSIIAWKAPAELPAEALAFRIVGAHTDSPGFRIKPKPDVAQGSWHQLGVEVYGGPLLNSWLDRDLGLAGRVSVRDDSGATVVRNVRDDRAILRIPQLAIHLDRDIGEGGLKLDRQRHLAPIWGLAGDDTPTFPAYLAQLLDCAPDAISHWDIAPFDRNRAARVGRHNEMISSARLDNLVSCHAGVIALGDDAPGAPPSNISVLACFDHEEVGSTSTTGAAGAHLAQVLERISISLGATRAEFLAALARSHAVSVDMAHATHPNYPERHEPSHPIALNAGPAVKFNAQQRYATDVPSTTPLVIAAQAASVPLQQFVSHSAMPCGSTIGPATAAALAIPVVDVGVPQLAMHSVRELCGAVDPFLLTGLLRQYLHAA